MALAQVSASLSLSIHDACTISSPRTYKISRLPISSFAGTGSIFATGSPILTRGPFPQRKPACRAAPFSIKCEQSTQKSSSLDVWLGRFAMVGEFWPHNTFTYSGLGSDCIGWCFDCYFHLSIRL